MAEIMDDQGYYTHVFCFHTYEPLEFFKVIWKAYFTQSNPLEHEVNIYTAEKSLQYKEHHEWHKFYELPNVGRSLELIQKLLSDRNDSKIIPGPGPSNQE